MATTYNSHAPLQAPGFIAQTGQARIAYFMTRNNGLPVPLIPADELPFTVKLQDVSRVLNPEQTYGLHYVGSAPYTGDTFKLERDLPSPAIAGAPMQRSASQPANEIAHSRTYSSSGKQFLAPNALARQAFAQNVPLSNLSYTSIAAKRPVSAAQAAKSWRRSDFFLPSPNSTDDGDAAHSFIDGIPNSSLSAEVTERNGYRSQTSTPPSSGIIPDQERKEYCTHWILQGWCAYEQQGCRYKHEMLDKEGLLKIGIRHVPRWWQELKAPIKLGGERSMVVGPLKKSEEWLRVRKGSDADSERSSTTESEQETLSTEASAEQEYKSPEEEAKNCMNKSEAAREEKKLPVIAASRPPTPILPAKARQTSAVSDLISFAPLLPTPSSSTTSESSMAVNFASSMQILKRTAKLQEPGQKADMLKKIETPTKTTRIFVPAGESPEAHIAQLKKRERVARTKTARTPSPAEEAETPKQVTASPLTSDGKSVGLSSSRWADAASPADDSSSEKKTRKLTKTGCRPRRPASSSPTAKVRSSTLKN